MNAADRRQELLNYLGKHQIGYTSALCEVLNVSAMTIHRDFAALAKQGLVTIIRGGAAINHGTAVLHSLRLRQTRLPLEKRRIAAHCAALVSEGSTVFLDCGSTVERLAEELRTKKNLTILTNSLDAAQILTGGKDNRLIMVPGVFSAPMRGFFGQMTADFMENFLVDLLFLGANGVDAGRGLTSPDYTDAGTKKALIRNARRVVVAADHTKLGQSFFERIAPLAALDRIVTDDGASPEILAELRAAGARIEAV